jgi:hypothetical protein
MPEGLIRAVRIPTEVDNLALERRHSVRRSPQRSTTEK